MNDLAMRKISYYLRGLVVGIDYYLECFAFWAIKSKEYSDLAHSPRGLEAEKWSQWTQLHEDFIKSFPIVAGLLLSSVSIVISIVALLVAVFK